MMKEIEVDSWLTNVAELLELDVRETFLLVIKLGVDSDLIAKIQRNGMKPGADYIYLYHDIRLCSCTNYYLDVWGNEISLIGELKKCNIRFKGWNSKLIIGEKVQIGKDVEINIGSNCNLYIGNHVNLGSNGLIRCEDNASILIGNGCRFENYKIVSRSHIIMGENNVFNEGLILIAERDSKIEIGKDVLVSSNVHMRSGSGHSLFDITEGINLSKKASHILIKNHVWIGQDVTILYNTELNDGCMVGAKSLVKGIYEPQSLLYGVPAKTMKKHIGWDIRNDISYEEFIRSTFN